MESYTSSDYEAYSVYRLKVQQMIDKKIGFLVMDTWNERATEQSILNNIFEALQ